MRTWTPLVLGVGTLTVSACFIVGSHSLDPVSRSPQRVTSPVRAFLADGSMVVFRDGARVTDTEVTGAGERYDLLRNPVGPATAVSLDSVLGMEAFNQRTDPGLTILASVGATTLAIGGIIGLACAADPKCFGSCPTVYSYDEEGEVLEAETFSYSISPLLEARDVDRLSVAADSDGVVNLEVRNEALETHFINHLELLEVRHRPGERVLTDHENLPAVVGPARPFDRAVDRSGRDVTAVLATRGDGVFSSAPTRVAASTDGDARDWIEMTLPPVPSDTAAVVLRLRNSLLNTVLFYEFMLGDQGARALDWMARDIEQIGTAVELGDWYHRTMGLRLEVETDDGFEEVARLGDTGPIAWKEMAFRVPVRPGESTRIRLESLTDEWRIDQAGWAPAIRRPPVRALSAVEIEPLVPGGADDLRERVAAADESYLVTGAGTGFTIRFDAGPVEGGGPETERTFLLSSQGYYTEWVRPHWIRTAEADEPFRPSDDLVSDLMAHWSDLKGPMEDAFHATRIPVR